MNIVEAIERLEKHAIIAENHYNYSLRDAFRLGIEALRYIVRSRGFGEYPVNRLLPGETENLKEETTMNYDIEILGHKAKIDFVSARQADGLWYKEDFLLVTLTFEEAVESFLGLAVHLPVKRYGREEFLAKVKAEAEITLPKLLEGVRDIGAKRKYSLEKQKELDGIVDEIKDAIGL